tara:strand:- start:65 stop:235 length:171 start_codon:yes stop_codon:yes gene_type:complete
MIIYLVVYKDHNNIEGFVKSKQAFTNWLKQHNKERVKDGQMIELEGEFELKRVMEL